MLTRGELERYERQITIRGFGKEGQEKLKKPIFASDQSLWI